MHELHLLFRCLSARWTCLCLMQLLRPFACCRSLSGPVKLMLLQRVCSEKIYHNSPAGMCTAYELTRGGLIQEDDGGVDEQLMPHRHPLALPPRDAPLKEAACKHSGF